MVQMSESDCTRCATAPNRHARAASTLLIYRGGLPVAVTLARRSSNSDSEAEAAADPEMQHEATDLALFAWTFGAFNLRIGE